MLTVILSCACAAAPAIDAVASPGNDPVALVRAYFQTEGPIARREAAARIASHRDYRPGRLREWLHRGAPFDDLPPGPREIVVDVGAGQTRRVSLILPEGYRADRAWPLSTRCTPRGCRPRSGHAPSSACSGGWRATS